MKTKQSKIKNTGGLEIRFQTKEESKRIQQETFLNLSGSERVELFLQIAKKLKRFPTKSLREKSKNFIIDFSN